jgi:hypothetical protein
MNWLARNNRRIDFTKYPEKSREKWLSMIQKLHELEITVRPLLESTMKRTMLLFGTS